MIGSKDPILPDHQQKATAGTITPATPPAAEVSFYRSLSIGQDTRRRSSASRFHITGPQTRELERVSDPLLHQDDNQNRTQMIKNHGSRLGGQRVITKKHLPWFSCMGNGCL